MGIPAQTQHIEFQRTAAPPGFRGGWWRRSRRRFGGQRDCFRPGVAGRLGGVAHLQGMSKPDLRKMDALGLEPMLTVADLSALLGVSASTICSSLRSSAPSLASGERVNSFSARPASVYDWRIHGKGPVAHRLGKHLKYAVADVRTWVDAQRESAPGTGLRYPQPRTGSTRPPATVVVNHHHRDDTATQECSRRRDDVRVDDGGVR